MTRGGYPVQPSTHETFVFSHARSGTGFSRVGANLLCPGPINFGDTGRGIFFRSVRVTLCAPYPRRLVPDEMRSVSRRPPVVPCPGPPSSSSLLRPRAPHPLAPTPDPTCGSNTPDPTTNRRNLPARLRNGAGIRTPRRRPPTADGTSRRPRCAPAAPRPRARGPHYVWTP